ncbi:hypothetical protein HUJ05_007707 [Dendroctonus ponderosae]|nr:hypothetical protein HUJ05_007707 [Dendroctonus ponderosae]
MAGRTIDDRTMGGKLQLSKGRKIFTSITWSSIAANRLILVRTKPYRLDTDMEESNAVLAEEVLRSFVALEAKLDTTMLEVAFWRDRAVKAETLLAA